MGHSRVLLRRCSWLVLAVCCQVSQAATRGILQPGSAPMLQIAPYKQCGGSAGCPNSVACSDAAWPGSGCPHSYICTRFDQSYWQCRRPGDMATASRRLAATTQQQPQLTAYAWSQCGGSLCPDYIPDKSICSDAIWATCPAGLTCMRRDQWYYQCRDTPFPESVAGTGLTAYAWSQCGGSLCPDYIPDKSICSDALWASCPAGLTCMRRDQWYYQCRDKPFPESPVGTSLTAYTWSQCGGSLCPDYIPDKSICSDAVWASCPAGLTCMRRDQWYYQCREQPFPESVAGTGLTAYAWSQCGGSLCPDYIPDKSICADAVWASCPAGLTCMRRDQWYYQCRDKPFPESYVAQSNTVPAVTGGSQQQQQQQQQQVQLTAYAWSQCGGSLCPDYIPDKSICSDAVWASCPAGLTCMRRDQWYYQCRDKPFPESEVAQSLTVPAITGGPQQQQQQVQLTAYTWSQCGGSLCPDYIPDKSICSDVVWASCPAGLTCMRRDQWYYQCRDKPFPESSAVPAVQSTPVPAVTGDSQQQQQQQVQPTAYAWSQCGGSACPDYIPDKSICGDKAWAKCPVGSYCYRRTPWYWQCRDSPFSVLAAATAAGAAAPPAAQSRSDPVITEIPDGALDADVEAVQATGK